MVDVGGRGSVEEVPQAGFVDGDDRGVEVEARLFEQEEMPGDPDVGAGIGLETEGPERTAEQPIGVLEPFPGPIGDPRIGAEVAGGAVVLGGLPGPGGPAIPGTRPGDSAWRRSGVAPSTELPKHRPFLARSSRFPIPRRSTNLLNIGSSSSPLK